MEYIAPIKLTLGKVLLPQYVKTRCITCEMTIELFSGYNSHREPGDEYFSISVCFWNKTHTNCYICGQCQDTLMSLVGNQIREEYREPLNRLFEIKKQYHLYYTKLIPEETINEILEIADEIRSIALK